MPNTRSYKVAATTGMQLITPTSIAFTGGSATSVNGKTVFSGVSTLSINGVFTSEYDNYIVMWSNITSPGSVMTYLRMRASGTDTTSGYTTVAGYQNAGAAMQYNPDSTSGWYAFQANTPALFLEQYFLHPNVATNTAFDSTGTGANYSYAKGWVSNSTQYDGFTITNASTTNSGTVRVYGFKN